MRVIYYHAVVVNLRAAECNFFVNGYAPNIFRVNFFVLNLKYISVRLNDINIFRVAVN